MNRPLCVPLLLFALSFASPAQQQKWSGSWSATIGTGGTILAGTWDGRPGEQPGTIVGTWALRDRNGAELATGTWAAAKDNKVWRGSWQARRSSGQVYDGTWRAQLQLPAASRLADMFEAAIAAAVSGTWRMGSYAGAWSIRASANQ